MITGFATENLSFCTLFLPLAFITSLVTYLDTRYPASPLPLIQHTTRLCMHVYNLIDCYYLEKICVEKNVSGKYGWKCCPSLRIAYFTFEGQHNSEPDCEVHFDL